MYRRPAAVLSLLFLLAACSGSSSAVTCTQQYWDGLIGICLPTGWKVVDHETMKTRGVPGEVVAAFQVEKSIAGQFPTVTVTREAVSAGTDSTTYSQASVRSVATLPSYKVIDSREAKVDGKAVLIHIFSAKPLPDEPERRFYQVSAVKDTSGYTFTAITPLAIDDTLQKQLLLMMNAVTLTEPAAKK